MLEFGLVWVRDEVVYAWLGPEEGRRYLPLMWTIFFFILFSNLFGLFPFTMVPFGRTDALSVATGNLAVTGAMASIVFVVVLLAGFRKHGFGGYWGTLVPDGVPMLLVPVIFVLEFIGLLTRAFALAIRLFANMLAGHALLGILFSFVIGIYVFAHPWQAVLPTLGSTLFLIGIFLFEVLIALIQAYIFTILSVIFVSISVADDALILSTNTHHKENPYQCTLFSPRSTSSPRPAIPPSTDRWAPAWAPASRRSAPASASAVSAAVRASPSPASPRPPTASAASRSSRPRSSRASPCSRSSCASSQLPAES